MVRELFCGKESISKDEVKSSSKGVTPGRVSLEGGDQSGAAGETFDLFSSLVLDRGALKSILKGEPGGDNKVDSACLPKLDLTDADLLVCSIRQHRRESRETEIDGTAVIKHRDGSQTTERPDGSAVTVKNGRLQQVLYPNGSHRAFEYSNGSNNPVKITLTYPGKTDSIVWKQEKGVWKSDTGQEFTSTDFTKTNGDYKYKDSKGAVTVLKSDGTRLEFSAKEQLTDVRYADGREAHFEWDQSTGKLNKASLRDGTKLQREGNEWKVVVAGPALSAGVQKLELSFSKDGAVTIKDAKENEHVFRVNGDRCTRYPHGTSDIERMDGSRVIEKDVDTKAKLVRHNGGNLLESNDKGEPVALRTGDGVWRKRDDTWFFKKPGTGEREVEFKGRIIADERGNCRVEQEDKTRITFRTDGTRLREFPTGRTVSELQQRDGSVLRRLRNGNQEQVLPDGSKVEIDRRGKTSAVTDAKGTRWEVAFDSSGRLKNITTENHSWTRLPGQKSWRNEKGGTSDILAIMPIEQLGSVFIRKHDELLKFRRDAVALESRLKSNVLTEGKEVEISKSVHEQIARLLLAGDREKSSNAKGDQVRPRIDKEDRVMLARQVMHHAAHPYRTDQGYHGTCSVSTVETRLYTRRPDFVAKLIADVALTGSYKSGDGTVYNFAANDPTLKKDGDGATRSLASQLFVATAVNVFWSNQEKDPDGKAIDKGSLRYEQRRINRGKKDGGECLVDTKTGKVFTDWSAINISRVVEMSRRLTGDDERFAITHLTRGKYDDVIGVTSKEQLRNELIRMKKDKLLPASTSVNTGNRFFGDAPDKPTMHAVSIVDFDEKTNTVMVDNQWGVAADYLGLPDTSRRLTLDEFYQATIWKEKDEEKKPPPKDR